MTLETAPFLTVIILQSIRACSVQALPILSQRGQSRQLALWFGNGTLVFHQSGAVLFIRPVFMEINEEESGRLCCSGVRNLECYWSRKSDTPRSLMSQTVISATRYESHCSPLNSHRCFQALQGVSSGGVRLCCSQQRHVIAYTQLLVVP